MATIEAAVAITITTANEEEAVAIEVHLAHVVHHLVATMTAVVVAHLSLKVVSRNGSDHKTDVLLVLHQ
jgi:hypothetical protein